MRITHPIRSIVDLFVRRAPVEAQLIVTRRCNLSCGYCSEYDHTSGMIELDVLRRRIDALHRLRAVNITLLGGEPLMHPEIDALVRHGARRAQVSITTNGFLLTEALVERLNAAGLANLQLSVDRLGVDRTRYIQKSLRTLRPKLELLRRAARFDVHVNIVLCEQTLPDFATMVREISAFGFRVTAGPMHDDRGAVQVSGVEYVAAWDYLYERGSPFSYADRGYGRRLLSGERPAWRCRAGSRMLYVDEFGRVQLCSAQRGRLDVPLEEFDRRQARALSRTDKGCEAGCSLLCVYRDSMLDNAPLRAVGGFITLARRGGVSRRAADAPIGAGEALDCTT